MDELNAANMEKIRSPLLLEEATSNSDARHVVIIEVDAPLPTLSFSERSTTAAGRPAFRLNPPEPNDLVETVRNELKDVLPNQELRYLTSSRSFIVEARGREIAKIAGISGVAAIWPNTHRS